MNLGHSDVSRKTATPIETGFDPDADRLVDTAEAARILGCRPNTLNKARVYGGPFACRFVKLGRAVRYSTRDLAKHVERNLAASTSEHWAAI